MVISRAPSANVLCGFSISDRPQVSRLSRQSSRSGRQARRSMPRGGVMRQPGLGRGRIVVALGVRLQGWSPAAYSECRCRSRRWRGRVRADVGPAAPVAGRGRRSCPHAPPPPAFSRSMRESGRMPPAARARGHVPRRPRFAFFAPAHDALFGGRLRGSTPRSSDCSARGAAPRAVGSPSRGRPPPGGPRHGARPPNGTAAPRLHTTVGENRHPQRAKAAKRAPSSARVRATSHDPARQARGA